MITEMNNEFEKQIRPLNQPRKESTNLKTD